MTTNRTQEIFDKLSRGERLSSVAQTCLAAGVALRGEEITTDSKSAKIHIQAMTRAPFEHPEMGKVVYDLATMKVGQKLALDWEHGAIIGYARHEMTDYGLECDGTVISNQQNANHASNDALYCLKVGAPLQASVDWRGAYDLDFIPSNKIAQVNGLDVEGPCFIVKNWSWRALALCKVGADDSTRTQLNSAGDGLAPLPRKLTQINGDVPGHEFHGNQHTGGVGSPEHAENLSDKAEDSTVKARSSGKEEDHAAATEAHNRAAEAHAKIGNRKEAAYHSHVAGTHAGVAEGKLDSKNPETWKRQNTAGDMPAPTLKDIMPADTTPAVTQTLSAPAVTLAPTSAIADKPADAKGGEPAAIVSNYATTKAAEVQAALSQRNAVGDAAKGERGVVLQTCIDALSKWTNTAATAAIDFCKTALSALGQVNEDEELMEAGYYAKAAALEAAEDDSPEAIAVCHSSLRVCALVNSLVGWQLCSAKDGAKYVPKAKRGEVTQQNGDFPGHEFHGNQYVGGGGSGPENKASGSAHEASKSAGEKGTRQGHRDAKAAHEKAQAAHEKAGNETAAAYHEAMAHYHGAEARGGSKNSLSTEVAPVAAVEVTQQNAAPAAAPVVIPAEVAPPVAATVEAPPAVPSEVSQQNAAKDQEIADLKARLAAIPSGAKPIPTVPGNPQQLLSWPAAIEEVRKQMNSAEVTPQVYAEAAKRFPQLCQAQKIVRKQ